MNVTIVNSLIAYRRITKSFKDGKDLWERVMSSNAISPNDSTLLEMLLLCWDCQAPLSEIHSYIEQCIQYIFAYFILFLFIILL